MQIFNYILQTIIISGVLYLYYILFFNNKTFLNWNRFYLLATLLLSLLLPLITINISSADINSSLLKNLQAVAIQKPVIIYASGLPERNYLNVLPVTYLILAMVFLLVNLLSIIKILKLRVGHKAVRSQGVIFINTKIEGTPFSFFNYLFWNDNIPLSSPEGKIIFDHELVHIRQFHSVDKLFLQTLVALFWLNPFYYLIKRELYLVHEFIADRQSLENNTTDLLSPLLLKTVMSGNSIPLTNYFFSSPIKRRFNMLTKNHNKKAGYLSRLLGLLLIAIVFVLFSFKVPKSSVQHGSFVKAENSWIDTLPKMSQSPQQLPVPTKEKVIKNIDLSGESPELTSTIIVKDVKISKDTSTWKLNEVVQDKDRSKHALIVQDVTLSKDTTPGELKKVDEEMDQYAHFPGGSAAWTDYIVSKLINQQFTKQDAGTVKVQFIVEPDGSVKEVKAINMQNTLLAKVAINAIMDGPKWIPAKSNNKNVTSFVIQPVTFVWNK